ncbi:meiotically up-regulated protein [Purpureocillium lavendulum]|uniref:Meiotically up-regulated protein n=1 Tax=Purpureocillium lavendulum TaxID=1247861 RepID=A0AB34FW37_9HYPO|nr:meiotically up-regulated protein [Purpureocillium lavendulum]
MSGVDDADDVRRYQAPYSAHRPVPTISKYREEKAARQQNAVKDDESPDEGAASLWGWGQAKPDQPDSATAGDAAQTQQADRAEDGKDGAVDPGTTDPRQRRKEMKHRKKERAEREVTDPVTHLPVTIHDFTDEALDEVDINNPSSGSTPKTATGLSAKSKSDEQLAKEKQTGQQDHQMLANRFPPPDFDVLGQQFAAITRRGVTLGLSGGFLIVLGALALERWVRREHDAPNRSGGWLGTGLAWVTLLALSAAAIVALVVGVRDYTSRKISSIFEDELWDAHRRQVEADANKNQKETTAWLNSLLGSVWPLINPDLFASLSDTLEDVMQASLPKLVRMVSVEDIGQGSEALRILGIRWLPTAAAAHSVTQDGKLTTQEQCDSGKDEGAKKSNTNSDDPDPKQAADKKAIAEGMEGEEGDFVNMEVAFAYRTRSSSKSLKDRTKDMHLYLAFYLPGNIKIPVWVDLQGIIGIMRLRLQLTPDPPFFALCTMTFLGQPKVNLSCTPLSQHGLNIMDIPLISNFVQSAVDAAVAEYVAPKSLTLDLKDMLAGDDFKKDTNSVGVLMINIKRGYEFKMGDTPIPLVSDGSSDPYVSVGWAKFGRVLWSTRILMSEMEPRWDETCFVLVTPEELNIEERLRVQLWDSDRFTADDDLGRIEVPLKELMTNEQSKGRMWKRTDGFRALKSGDNMPGKLEWSVGYFSKARIQQDQFDKQTHDRKVRSMDQLRDKVDQSCERKLRETMFREGQTERDEAELQQQKAQELKSEQDAMIISAPPPDKYPSGLFSLQIHNITGLELVKLSKSQNVDDEEASDEEETGESLPSSYCTVIVNHSKTFKTRTKPQNAKPFFNAGCERFIRDWRDCDVYVSVRDARLHEDNPLLGIVHLPLGDIFRERSQVMGFWPLSGGIGHGRIRLSMVWRSVKLQAPRNLLGWNHGTVTLEPVVTSSDCPQNLRSCKLKFKTNISMGKLYPRDGSEARWTAKKDQNLSLAVHKRYSSCMSISFKDKGFFGDKIAAFCVLWLKDIPDEEEQELELPIWKGNFERATSNCLEDCGEKLGTLKLKLTFWAGMGAAHSAWASRNQNTRDVVEVIDTSRDNLDADKMEKEAGIVDEEASSDSDSSDDDDDDGDDGGEGKGKGDKIPDGSAGDKQGPLDQLRDYRKRDKALHRQHRGIMQWKVPRTARWVKHKFERVGDGVSGLFEHQSKQQGIETEV